jgi:hypothetical protein
MSPPAADTRFFAEAYLKYVAGAKPAENAAHREKGHFIWKLIKGILERLAGNKFGCF